VLKKYSCYHLSKRYSGKLHLAGMAQYINLQKHCDNTFIKTDKPMNNELIVKNEITINAPSAVVWDALTNPEQTKKYMFGCETVSDWNLGSPLLWKGSWEGKDMVFVKGSIVGIEPGKFLAYTTIDPNNPAVADIPENYLTVTYSLSEKNGQTLLTVTQGDYSKVAEGEKRYAEAYNGGEGWNPILVEIKKLTETTL
jgi:uncharacterized protein YndB with AHSA1/START domain